MREHSEHNGDGTVNISLSRESETMFRDDFNFIKNYKKNKRINVMTLSIVMMPQLKNK